MRTRRWYERLYFVKQEAEKHGVPIRNRAEWRRLARATRQHGDGRRREGSK